LEAKKLRKEGERSMRPFKTGDHVRWNSEAGIVRGRIIRKITADTVFKGYTHHASKEQPQYLIKSDKTDHVAIHKGEALKLIRERTRKPRGVYGNPKCS
jgi:hypothetical protein